LINLQLSVEEVRLCIELLSPRMGGKTFEKKMKFLIMIMTDDKFKERAENLADDLPPEEIGPWCK